MCLSRERARNVFDALTPLPRGAIGYLRHKAFEG